MKLKEYKMNYYKNILETVGNTPMVRLNNITNGLSPLLLTKLESFNPGGSSKDRIALSMIEEAEQKGLLKPGGTIIEPTSGNTGLGLAMVGLLKGYKLIFTMPDKMSPEKENILIAYGAEVIRTPTDVEPDDPRSYYQVAKRLVNEIPNSFSPNQYFNECNPKAHYISTGPEIWNDTKGQITHFIAGIGTGGTISGVAKYLKEKNPNIKIIGIDTIGSIYEDYFNNNEVKAHSYLIEGIGEDFIPPIVAFDLIDEIISVSDADAFKAAKQFVKNEGILTGSSGGAAIHAALQYSQQLNEHNVVVVLLPDHGRNYLSTLYNNKWLVSKGL